MNKTTIFTVRSISRPYLIALIIIIILLGLGPIIMRSLELSSRKLIGSEIFKTHVLSNKKEALKSKIDQQLSKLEADYNLYRELTDSTLFYSDAFQAKIQKRSLLHLIDLEAKIGGYIWVEKIINHKGGKNYAIQIYSPSTEKKDGDSISTFEKDERGNYFYRKELNAIHETPPQFYSYQWMNKKRGVVADKIGYSRLFKGYDWIIGSGVFLYEI
ncbi:MAG: hypothetical protein COB98_09255, partial [Flavobacteriaceae bacterium]